MNLDLDFMDIAGDRLSEMRLLVEGAITLFEDEASILCRLARDAGDDDARSAFNDIGSALYCMRRHRRYTYCSVCRYCVKWEEQQCSYSTYLP